MSKRFPADWMLSEAVDALARAERMHRQFFQLTSARGAPAWEPPIDMIETEREVLILVALPGVDPDAVEAVIEDGVLVVVGRRTLPPELRDAVNHPRELPQRRYVRRIALQTGRYTVRRFATHGCVGFSLAKTGRDIP
jgi:HSP20 family molecular chaperone IbpA